MANGQGRRCALRCCRCAWPGGGARGAPPPTATGGLADIPLPDGERARQTVRTALLPLRMAGQRLGVRPPPPVLGQHTAALMAELGYTPEQVQALQGKQAVA